ncbi:hypothetical protein PAF17_19005 [Paracoccus sp. Z330]|uniref:DUF3077 domain-containing protein n=1 Tax=Paracoccus onchidii TaxID=3017813 RepID=A0ABT4ZJM4_9RHOB|nr:hypothetical protein [Paracoccus onchidii]MDB6179564.1 hypothetical protein [Paracoccus onchidii]
MSSLKAHIADQQVAAHFLIGIIEAMEICHDSGRQKDSMLPLIVVAKEYAERLGNSLDSINLPDS